MIQQKNKEIPATERTFVVSRDNTNERGVMFPCKILNEITAINDELILQHFGFLDYDAINTLSFHVHITGQAFLNDLVQIEWEMTNTESGQLELLVFANRKIGDGYQALAEGSFIFRLAKLNVDPCHIKSAQHLLISYN